ncbi:rod shape-determining protein MreC [Lacticaseibacillus songhuajiangensis]|jgi:rod shape-determining protein MreC|uniref:rod shape-determining protein MreC n=1 Tax=Lacticaseibacillus songhuajiangensis TaxID=1296539 RepID=UPI000F791EF3|nr:rod shape-determining protein MreC [Lacticaseibacillus songhuajiangensis]MCI1283139.1 rod shape-determining protein MreC [Lacticaseibacillus songhuajiangensis]
MQKFFSNKRLIVLMVALLVCVGLVSVSVVVRDKKSTPPVVQQIGNDAVGIVATVTDAPANAINNGLDDIANLMNTYSENERLKSQVDSLAQTKVRNQTLQRENKQLKKELKLNATLTNYDTVTAAVKSRSATDWRNMIILDKGSVSGLKKNMPVMSDKGIIGRIVEVNQTNSKVELISTDNNAANRFAAQLVAHGKTVNGVISGYKTASGELVMGQMSTDVTVPKGTMVYTSGLGGRTPKGLLIGTVTSVKKDDYGLANTVYLKPAGNLNDVSVVSVIRRTIGG